MQYVQESLSPGEKILKVSHYHWMYLVTSCFWSIILILAAFATIFFGIVYKYYNIIETPPWMLGDMIHELALRDYFKAFWHINVIVRLAAFILILMAAVQICAALLVQFTTEIAVTTKRAILKRGFIARRVEEMRTDFIEGADVVQTVAGRIFGYGQLKIYGTGTESIYLPHFTKDPIAFRRALQSARTLSVQQTENMIQQVAQQQAQMAQQPQARPQALPELDNQPPLEPR